MIYITGDTHGEQKHFLYSREERTWAEQDCIIVCGDFGFLFLDNYAENKFLDDLEQRPYTLAFVDGNHENFTAIYRYPVEEWNGGKVHRIRENIVHLMRGQVFTIQGERIFTFGGAYSIDRYMRKLDYSWWKEEIPCAQEYKEAEANLQKHNYEVDLVLTHTAPQKIIQRMGYTPDPHDIDLTNFLDYVLNKVNHRHWYCGHWHLDQDITEKFTVLWYDVRKITPMKEAMP